MSAARWTGLAPPPKLIRRPGHPSFEAMLLSFVAALASGGLPFLIWAAMSGNWKFVWVILKFRVRAFVWCIGCRKRWSWRDVTTFCVFWRRRWEMFVNNFEREFERRLKSCLRHIKVESQGFRLVYQASKNMVVAKSSDQICIKFAGLKIIINLPVCRRDCRKAFFYPGSNASG